MHEQCYVHLPFSDLDKVLSKLHIELGMTNNTQLSGLPKQLLANFLQKHLRNTIKYNYIKVKLNMINYCEYCVGVNERVCVTLNCSSDMTRR